MQLCIKVLPRDDYDPEEIAFRTWDAMSHSESESDPMEDVERNIPEVDDDDPNGVSEDEYEEILAELEDSVHEYPGSLVRVRVSRSNISSPTYLDPIMMAIMTTMMLTLVCCCSSVGRIIRPKIHNSDLFASHFP